MQHFKEKIYQICASIAGILFAVFGLINSAELRQSDLTNIYILFAVVYGCVILLSLLLVFIEKNGSAAIAVLLLSFLAGSFSMFVNLTSNSLAVFQFAFCGVSATFAFLTLCKYGQSPARGVTLKRNIQLGNGIFNTIHFSAIIIFYVIWMFKEKNSVPFLFMLFYIAYTTVFLIVSIMLIKAPERTSKGFAPRRALDLIILLYNIFTFIGIKPIDVEIPFLENSLLNLIYLLINAASAVLCIISLSLSSEEKQFPTSCFPCAKLRFAATIFCLVRASFAVLDFFYCLFVNPEIVGNMYWQLILSVILLVLGAVTLAHSSENKKSIFNSAVGDIIFVAVHIAIIFIFAFWVDYTIGSTTFNYYRNPALCAVTISLLCVSLAMARKKTDAVPAEKTENEFVGASVESE